jgi:2-dehydro-3-deoxygluconokinase
VVWEPEGRAGLYFLELGATPRPSSVLYDRAESAFSHLQPGEIDWDAALVGARCLHLTGIAPAVSASAVKATLEALQAARRIGCKVSMDFNYRRKLWDPETARRTLLPMLEWVDILITAPGDTHAVLGIDIREPEALAGVLCERFPLAVAAVTVRQGASVWRCSWTAVACAGSQAYATRRFEIDIVDQVGRGDAFAAGFLYGYLPQSDVQRGLDYGVAFAALKHSIPGDLNWSSREEVELLLQGPPAGVSR